MKELQKSNTKLQLESQGYRSQLENIKKIKNVTKIKLTQAKVKISDHTEVIDKIIKDLVQMTKVEEHIEHLEVLLANIKGPANQKEYLDLVFDTVLQDRLNEVSQCKQDFVDYMTVEELTDS
jgi:light-regulated signal transduction histidine kinase (bacteriophytochrome)